MTTWMYSDKYFTKILRYSQCDLILHHEQNRSEYIMHIHHPAPQKHWTNYKMFVKGRPSKTQRFENANRPFALQVPEKFPKTSQNVLSQGETPRSLTPPPAIHPSIPAVFMLNEFIHFIRVEWERKMVWRRVQTIHQLSQTERDGYWTSHPPSGLYDKRNESFTQHQAGEADIYSTLMKWHISTMSL